MTRDSTYGEIVRSSTIVGGAQAVNYVVGLVRVKAIALLLGPTGVGVIGLYTSATRLVGSVTELGLRGSSVRSIAQAAGRDDAAAVARTTRMLRRLCWATGILGWLASALLAVPLSRWMFKSDAHAWALAVLGATLLMTAISGGQLGLLQGLRRIGDIARVQVAEAVINTAIAIGLYLWLGLRGIVPVLVVGAAVSLGLSWWFARRVRVEPVAMGWDAAIAEAKPLLALGFAMMWSTVLGLAADLFTRTLVSRALGVDAAGVYQAAWALSGTFAGFVLGAMGVDFYPRLTALIRDRAAATRAVNEQTEIGILLALPGLLVLLALSKWVILLLYSAKFAAAGDVLLWMALGVFGRVLSWPLGFVQLALGAARWFMATEAIALAVQVGCVVLLLPRFGVVGTGYAFAISYVAYTIGMLWVVRRLIGFGWSLGVWRLVPVAALLVALAFASNRLVPGWASALTGSVIALAGGLWSVRGLAARLGRDHRLVRWVRRIPLLARLLGA